ncbi:MAG TPA: response regulator transcription factor [Thermoanaerobaculia bacterium]
MTRRGVVASKRFGNGGERTIRVAVLSDEPLFGESLARQLGGDPAYLIVSCASSAGWRAASASDADVILLDARTPDALPLCAVLAREGRGRVLFVAAPDDDGWAAEALDVGARGIFARETTPDDLQTAIQIVHDGLIWARRRVITTRIDQLAAKITAAARSVDLLEQRLSLREREVFRHAATGLGNKQLARRLDISEATVKVHLTHIFQKLGVSGRAELAAAYHGIVNPAAPREGHVE